MVLEIKDNQNLNVFFGKMDKLKRRDMKVVNFCLSEYALDNIITHPIIQEKCSLEKMQVKRAVKKLSDIYEAIELKKDCPHCGHSYKERIPRSCVACSSVIFPNLHKNALKRDCPYYIVSIDRKKLRDLRDSYAKSVLRFN